MRFRCLVALAATLSVLPAAPADEKARAEAFAALKAKFEAESEETYKRFQAASSPEETKAIQTEAKELYVLTAGKAVRLAAQEPKDAVAVEAAVFAVERLASFGVSGEDMDKATQILIDHHLNNPKLRKLIGLVAARGGAAGKKLVKAAAEGSTDTEIKGVALLTLGAERAEEVDNAGDGPKGRELAAEAARLLEQAIAVAKDAPYNETTVGKEAGEELVALKTLRPGKPAPDAEGTNLHTGKKEKLSDYRGKVVVLDVWATWCGPCRDMIPHERDLVAKLKDKPFVLLSVSVDDEKERLDDLIKKERMAWTHWWDGPDGPLKKEYKVRAFPTLYVIDAKGVIRHKYRGNPGDEVLDKVVTALVEDAEKK